MDRKHHPEGKRTRFSMHRSMPETAKGGKIWLLQICVRTFVKLRVDCLQCSEENYLRTCSWADWDLLTVIDGEAMARMLHWHFDESLVPRREPDSVKRNSTYAVQICTVARHELDIGVDDQREVDALSPFRRRDSA